jgi:hypothetical protein
MAAPDLFSDAPLPAYETTINPGLYVTVSPLVCWAHENGSLARPDLGRPNVGKYSEVP